MSASVIDYALETQRLSVRLGEHTVLNCVDACFPRGAWSCIVGPNGAGKSSLLKAMAQLIPSDGELRLNGSNFRQLPAKLRAQKMAWLGQNQPVPESFSVQDAVMLGRLPWQTWLGSPSREDFQAVETALAMVNAAHLAGKRMANLSGGEQQRVLLARLFATQADVLLLDEPLAHLDLPQQVNCVKILRHLSARGVTVVTVMHELNMALQADYGVFMQAGQVVYQGAMASEAAHQTMESLFEQSMRVHRLEGQLSAQIVWD